MTDITDHVTSLELSKKLDTLGLKKNSHFEWLRVLQRDAWEVSFRPPHFKNQLGIPAYLASELGYMLPWKIKWMGLDCYLKTDVDRHVYYGSDECEVYPTEDYANEGESDSRARMLIHLIENGIVKVEELNDDIIEARELLREIEGES